MPISNQMNDQPDSFPVETAWNSLPAEISTEYTNILQYWEHHTVDNLQGGFAGSIDQSNQVNVRSPKGSVLNSRILWSFSAAYNHGGNPEYLALAIRAFHFIRDYFTDPEFGGLYWLTDYQGNKLDTHKQIYAQAFGIYGMSEYYRAAKDPRALEQAIEWYHLIENHSRDPVHGGYIDAFSRDWSSLDDKRLSAKDENAPKTMNTHLHIVEAYANLYEVWPSRNLRTNIIQLLRIFDEKIIHPESHHLDLFFSNDWQTDSGKISYGHDIEAAWLLQSCAQTVGDMECLHKAKKNALLITDASMKGLDHDGGLWYEYDQIKNEWVYEKHWWPQAEAMVGFCNAWQLTGSTTYKTALLNSWNFIRHHIIDNRAGEWFWGVDRENNIMKDQDKTGIWKCPYHNTRACLELLKRLTL